MSLPIDAEGAQDSLGDNVGDFPPARTRAGQEEEFVEFREAKAFMDMEANADDDEPVAKSTAMPFVSDEYIAGIQAMIRRLSGSAPEGEASQADRTSVVAAAEPGVVDSTPQPEVKGVQVAPSADNTRLTSGASSPEAEHAATIAAGERLETIASSVSDGVSFADFDAGFEAPSTHVAAMAPSEHSNVVDGAQVSAEKDEKGLSVDDKTTITPHTPGLEARAGVSVEKSAREGETTEKFTDKAGLDIGTIEPKELRIDDVVAGTYVIRRKLSSGGMGALYEAYDRTFDRQVAVKVILSLSGDAAEAKDQVDRFRAEGKAMAKVAHEGLAQVYGTGVWDGTPYLVMELCRGGDLKSQLEEHGLPSGKQDSTKKVKSDTSKKVRSGSFAFFDVLKAGALRATRQIKRQPMDDAEQTPVPVEVTSVVRDSSWTVQGHTSLIKKLAGALSMVHKQGVVHRDLKPANVMYADKEKTRPVVIDFGLVPLKDERTDVIFGTPNYMSPEQVRSDPALDYRTDVYSLGAVFYELVTGKVPYQDQSVPMNSIGIMERILTHTLTPAALLNRGVDVELSAIIDKMMAREVLIDKVAIRARVQSELELRSDFAELTDDEKATAVREQFEEEYAKECESRKIDAEGAHYRYESMDEVIADIDLYEKGLPVKAMTYDDRTREAKERAYWERMNPEEAQAKRDEERKAAQWVQNKRRAGVGIAALVLAFLGHRANEWHYAMHTKETVSQARTRVTELSERASRESVASIGSDVEAVIEQVLGAESLVSEWVLRQESAEAMDSRVHLQEDRLAVVGLRESLYASNVQLSVAQVRASVRALSERAARDGVANIGSDLVSTVAQVSSAEALVSEWVVRQRSADAAQGQVHLQEDRRAVEGLQDSLRRYREARVLLADYRRARVEEQDFGRAYQLLFRSYELSREAVAEEAGSRGLDDARASALVDDVDRLRTDAVARRLDYSRERIEAYRVELRRLYRSQFLRQLPGGQAEFDRETVEAGKRLLRELLNPLAIDLQRVQVTPEMRSSWTRLQYEARTSAEELVAELRALPGLEQNVVLGARQRQHNLWADDLNRARLEERISDERFIEARERYRVLRQDASLSENEYHRQGAELLESYLRAPEAPNAPPGARKHRRVH